MSSWPLYKACLLVLLCWAMDQLIKQELADNTMDWHWGCSRDIVNTQWVELILVLKRLTAALKIYLNSIISHTHIRVLICSRQLELHGSNRRSMMDWLGCISVSQCLNFKGTHDHKFYIFLGLPMAAEVLLMPSSNLVTLWLWWLPW